MKTRSNRATAIITSMVILITLLVPAGAFAAKPLQKADYTFTESEENDGSFSETITVDLGRTKVGNKYYDNQYSRHEVTGQLPQGLRLIVKKDNNGDAVVELVDKAVNHTSRDEHSVSISVKFFYTYNSNSRNPGNVTKTFNIMFRDNKTEPQPTPSPTDEPGAGQAEKLNRAKIRVLEIYPHDISREKEEVSQMDVVSRLGKDSRFEVTTMSINRLISLKDEINGKYDIVYFNGGKYTRNNVNEYSYGSDITVLCAGKLKEFIESGQLCIFHEDIFDKNSDPLGNETILKQQFKSYIYNQAYPNVIVVTNNKGNKDKRKQFKDDVINNLYNLYADTQKGMNPRPILEIVEAPAAYSAENTEPVSNRLTFRFKVYDPNTDEDADLKVALYIDRNNDSLYNDKEVVYYQDDGDGVKYTLKVKNGRSGTITYDMPQGLTGVFFWKLVVMDEQNARDEFESVFRLKGKQITVKVLQIKPDKVVSDNSNVRDTESDGHGNLSLNLKFKNEALNYGHTYAERPGEYRIEVEEMTVKEFNEKASKEQIELNGNYDMVILGFNDNYTDEKRMNWDYSGALGPAAVELLDDFIKTKQSVMFTHDTIHFTYNRYLTAKFGTAVGQMFSADGAGDFNGIWTAGLVGDPNLNQSSGTFTTDVLPAYRDTARNNIGKYDPTGHYQAINTYPDTATRVKPVNSSVITLYPFILEGGDYSSPDKMEVAATHFQWYKLNLEDPEVVPLFNLYVAGKDKINDDAMNNYYTYTKGTITYSGTGHKRDNNKRYPDFETKLFVNTAIKAYQIANHAPEVTILEPQDNSKVSRSEGDLELKFRAYDFDLGDDYLYYEVFIDTENKGRDEDFVSLTDGRKIRMANGQQVSFTIPEDKLPEIGKFRIKVYAEDEHEAGSFSIITVEMVDSPLITPEIVLCDADGNPIEGALVNQDVKAMMKFKVSGKTSRETKVTPVFDLKGAYDTEAEKGYLEGENLDEIVFSDKDPEPKEITRDHSFTVDPSEPGTTSLTMTVTVRKREGLFDEKSSADSIGVRNGHVEFYVKDENGNPVRNAPIIDEETGKDIGVTNDSGYLFVDGLVGVKNFKPGSIPGFDWNGNKTISMQIKDEEGNEKWVTADQVHLTYENHRWKVEFTVEFSHGLSIEYYRPNINYSRLIEIGEAKRVTDGDDYYEVRNHKLTPAVIVAKVNVEPLVSGEVRKIEFKVETKQIDGEAETDVTDATPKAAIVNAGVGGMYYPLIANLVPDEWTQLMSVNELPEGSSYAGRTYFLLIEVPKTDSQIVRISEVTLTTHTVTGSEIEKKITYSNGVKYIPTAPPMLR